MTAPTTDVAIVGGGVIGLAVAHALAKRARAVTVIEAARIGERAAAGVAAGMLAPSSEADLSDPRLTTFALASQALYAAWAANLEAESGVDTGYDATGTLMVALHHDHLALIEHLHAFQLERGLAAERLTARQAREEEPYLAPGIAGALRMPDAQVDPRRLLRALTIAIERAGGHIVEDTRVTGVTADGASGYAKRYAAAYALVAYQ
ncbi:MAG: FAD-dependent oxidoreductase, partial [Chloroflexota bacterium]